MAEEKYQQVEVGTIGRHTMSQKGQGGNDPQSLIDAQTGQSKVPLTYQFPEDLPVHQFLMIFYEYNFFNDYNPSQVLTFEVDVMFKIAFLYNFRSACDLGP